LRSRSWSELRGAVSRRQIPAVPGSYRVRRAGDARELVYVGQTGRSLRGRLGQLNAAHQAEMPYSDLHVAAPALRACGTVIRVTSRSQ